MAKLMTAKYAGKCRTCGSTFPVGASIAHVARGDARHALCTSEGRAAATADAHKCNVTCTVGNCRKAESDYLDRMGREQDAPVGGDLLCDGSEADHARLGCVCPDLSPKPVSNSRPARGRGYRAGQAGKWRDGVFFRGCGCEDYPCCGH